MPNNTSLFGCVFLERIALFLTIELAKEESFSMKAFKERHKGR
jgi:hypothetical protein